MGPITLLLAPPFPGFWDLPTALGTSHKSIMDRKPVFQRTSTYLHYFTVLSFVQKTKVKLPYKLKWNWLWNFQIIWILVKGWLYLGCSKGQLILKCPFGVFKSSKKPNEILSTISVLAFKGPRFSEKDWYYLQAQTDMPVNYLKLVVWIFARFFATYNNVVWL